MTNIQKHNPDERWTGCKWYCDWWNNWQKSICWIECRKLRLWSDRSDKKFHFNADEIKKINKYFEISPINDFKKYLWYLNEKIFNIISSEAEYQKMIMDEKIKHIY